MQREKGYSLIDTLVSIALMGLLAVILLMSLSTAFKAAAVNKEKVTAEGLAGSQLESLKTQDYIKSADYDPIDPLKRYAPIEVPDELTTQGYTIEINSPQTIMGEGNGDYELQSITVVIRRNGQATFTSSCYKLGSAS